MTRTVHGLDTRLVHAGEPEPRILGAVVAPIFQSVTFEQGDAQGEVRYLRLGNTPGQLSLQRKLAALESAEGALVMASGMAAISTALLTLLGSGDHLLAQDCLYGGTLGFLLDECASFGISVDRIDAQDPASC